jgi:hypothetical protein
MSRFIGSFVIKSRFVAIFVLKALDSGQKQGIIRQVSLKRIAVALTI